MAFGVVAVEAQGIGHGRVDPEAAALDILGRYEGVRPRVIAVAVDEPDGVKDLHRVVGVEARQDLRDDPKVPVQKLDQAAVVIDCAAPRASTDEQLERGDAERVLDVDYEQADPKRVFGGCD